MNPPVNSPAIKVVKSVREQVSAEEWQARVDLARDYPYDSGATLPDLPRGEK